MGYADLSYMSDKSSATYLTSTIKWNNIVNTGLFRGPLNVVPLLVNCPQIQEQSQRREPELFRVHVHQNCAIKVQPRERFGVGHAAV